MLTIRLMKAEDERPLRKLVIRYLKETFDGGGDILPTLENAAGSVKYALDGAAVGDPCIVAEDDDKIVGYIICRGVSFPGITTRYKTIRSWGTYIKPEYRRQGTAIVLLTAACRLARFAGYDRFMGFTFGTDYEKHASGLVNRVSGIHEVGKVVVMDLTRNLQPVDKEAPIEVH